MELKEVKTEREIRVFDLLISLCQRWRSLLVCLIIGAVVLGAYGWFTSASGAGSSESSQAAWSAVLGPDEMNEVEQLFNSIEEYNELVQEQSNVTDMSQKLENMDHITTIQNNIVQTKARFSDDQKAYLAFLMGDTSIVPGSAETYNHKNNASASAASGSKRYIRKKYVIAGALLGLILAAIVIIIKYIGKATIKTAGEMEENLGLPVLGRFDGSDRFYDKRKTALDRWLRKVKQKNKQKPTYEESTKLVAAKIQIASERKDLKRICIAVDSNVQMDKVSRKEFLEDIIAEVGERPEVFVMSNILGRSDALQEMSGADGVVLVLQTENSRFHDALYERLLCESYGVFVPGAIVVE